MKDIRLFSSIQLLTDYYSNEQVETKVLAISKDESTKDIHIDKAHFVAFSTDKITGEILQVFGYLSIGDKIYTLFKQPLTHTGSSQDVPNIKDDNLYTKRKFSYLVTSKLPMIVDETILNIIIPEDIPINLRKQYIDFQILDLRKFKLKKRKTLHEIVEEVKSNDNKWVLEHKDAINIRNVGYTTLKIGLKKISIPKNASIYKEGKYIVINGKFYFINDKLLLY